MTIEPIREKLDEKIKQLNSSRIFKKVTPKGDKSWYIKWVSSFFILIAMAMTSADIFPQNLMFHLLGVSGWLVVGMLWHDRALIVLNAVGIVFLGIGIFKYISECTNCMIPL